MTTVRTSTAAKKDRRTFRVAVFDRYRGSDGSCSALTLVVYKRGVCRGRVTLTATRESLWNWNPSANETVARLQGYVHKVGGTQYTLVFGFKGRTPAVEVEPEASTLTDEPVGRTGPIQVTTENEEKRKQQFPMI